ncbi:MAG: hypothetical protein ACI94Y_001773 [Maribacter sp.]
MIQEFIFQPSLGMVNNIIKINFIAVLLTLLPLIVLGQVNDETIVWPGDVNNNGVVNHVDVLYIGAAYGFAGEARDTVTIQWDSAAVPDSWGMAFQNNGLSVAFADCDGNGVVEDADLAAIGVNYGLEHDLLLSDSFPQDVGLSDTELFFNTGGDNPVAMPGSVVSILVDLGTQNIPVDNFYGLAFTIEVNTNYIDMQSLIFDFESSWMDPLNETLITYQRRNDSTLDVVLSRRSMTTVSGGGTVGILSLIIEGDVPDFAPNIEVLIIKDVYIVDEELNQIYVTDEQSLYLDITSPIRELPKNEFSIYPNPVSKGICTIKGLEKYSDVEVRLLDIAGRQMKVELIDNNLHVGNLPTGIYFINVSTPRGVLTEKIFIK